MLLDNTRNAVRHLLKRRFETAVAVLGLMVWTASAVPHLVVLASPPPRCCQCPRNHFQCPTFLLYSPQQLRLPNRL